MSKIRVVTDSTADLTPELVERYGITVVPLTVLQTERRIKTKLISPMRSFTRFYNQAKNCRLLHSRLRQRLPMFIGNWRQRVRSRLFPSIFLLR